MNKGKVMSFNERSGYGFILMEDGREVFAHYTHILGEGFRNLNFNDVVEFDLYETHKGLEAHSISVLTRA